MVSARLVDFPEDDPMKPIPELMFAAGEEPVGVRVLNYQSPGAIQRILNTLEADEVEIIRRSAFGKIVDIAEKPVFSGRFARYVLSRQLKTKKKHELWFKFAGKPVRFSLREFAIVTGLPCGQFPRRSKLKLKKTISEKPYWPSLFGRTDVVTVASVIKMLWRKTVKDRDIRVKFACLAILESVLLPTSLKMKICRDHAEAIEDLDEFFSFPWGRVAFDMFVGSIKERDEVALSQNTIAVKGFALALQLVFVEAVPSLTEVVQETCSSSESDSDDELVDPLVPKKQTLNPAHARNVDRKCDAIVCSILSDDPDRPIEEASVIWSDEEDDETVDNLVDLINANHDFRNSMFVGGKTKCEVDRIRESNKPSLKSKKSKQSNPQATVEVDSRLIATDVIEKISPHLSALESKINEVSKRIDSIQSSFPVAPDTILKKFKDDLLETVASMMTSALRKGLHSAADGEAANPCSIGNCVSENRPVQNSVLEANEKSIRNVMENISDYSTPPTSPRNTLAENNLPSTNGNAEKEHVTFCPDDHGGAQSAHSQNHCRHADNTQNSEVDKRLALYVTEIPSFSLGLTQEEEFVMGPQRLANEHLHVSSPRHINVGDNIADTQASRKSKRQKTVPSALVNDFECGPQIMSRLRRSQKVVFVWYDRCDLQRKFAKLCNSLNRNIVIDVAGLSVSSKEILLIAERSRFFPPKVVDILLRLVRFVVLQQPSNEVLQNYYFLDSKFPSAFLRHYSKFIKIKRKDSYLFPKGLKDFFQDADGTPLQRRRFYFPFSFAHKHWVGICLDTVYGHLTVLDCNISYSDDEAMERRLDPFLHMLPYLIRQEREETVCAEVMRYTFDRPKIVSQNGDPMESGLMAVLFMVIHAVYGIEACKNITPDSLNEEGKSAAIMAYEFNERL